MAQLAIQGHKERGKEVIEILEMLGGKSYTTLSYQGNDIDRYYYINKGDNYINAEAVCRALLQNRFQVFTLEEFLEKFPYKVGYKVKVKETGKDVTIEGMSWRNGCEVIYDTCYNNDCVAFYSTEELQPYKEETMEEIIKIDIPKGYEFAGVDDDKQQVVFTKILSRYPKTYEECCEILGIRSDWHLTLELDTPATHDLSVTKEFDYVIKLESLRKLLICRNSYWKIAVEQMGLEKPWEPDLENEELYCIQNYNNQIVKSKTNTAFNKILIFPTEEMRDAFYENFKGLINETKELL